MVSGAAGAFWGGTLHIVTSPEHLLALSGLGLLLGQGGDRNAAEILPFVAAAALAAGAVLPLAIAPLGLTLTLAISIASLLIVGGLIAAALPLPRWLLGVLVALIGFGQGLANGEAMTVTTRPELFVPGVTLAGFLLVLYAMLLALCAKPFWARIALRVAGSWIAATGILVIGMPR